ncbi:50S ribosomal protein L18 [Candidatus Micrarchaeota archaeon]|nr:50S ribosomal protein L18 [Candidatus Micrarchaeota archaeon]
MTKAKSPTFNVHFRRRREGKTNFAKRLALIKSGKPRLVVRRSNKDIIVQFIEFDPKGDRTLLTVNGATLSKTYKWPSKRNSWTAYLAGLAAGKMAGKKGVSDFVFDMGMYTPSKGSITYAVLKGVVDAGLKTPYDKEKISEQKIMNPPEPVKSVFNTLRTKLMSG